MTHLKWASAFFCLAVTMNAFAGDWVTLPQQIVAMVDVDADGKVVEVKPLRDDLGAKLAESAGIAIRGWTFEPARRNGANVSARTYVDLAIEARKAGEAYDFRFRYLGNGPTYGDKRYPPTYPKTMISGRIEATVVYSARVMPDGTLQDIEVESARTTDGRSARLFAVAGKNAAMRWGARPELVGGEPIATQVRFPIRFRLHPLGDHGPGTPDAQLKISSDSPVTAQTPPAGEDMPIATDSPLRPKPGA
jgi:hypothetical protein